MITLTITLALTLTAIALYLITRNTPVLTIQEPTELDRLLAVEFEDWYPVNKEPRQD